MRYNVSYLDTMQGGSGLETVDGDSLHIWLANRPGVVIRRLAPHDMEACREHRTIEQSALRNMGYRMARDNE